MQSRAAHRICSRCYKKLAQILLPPHKTWANQHYSTNSLKWESKIVRSCFVDYFCSSHGHQFVKSSSVIPGKHQGTYFTNAGMNQFKPIFLGTAEEGSDLAGYRRAANSQKCIRVGGKHNDLDDVGADLTHHTFFEMLGSWSFGDYFKKEACSMALDLLQTVYRLPLDRLYFTYFQGDTSAGLDPDWECREIWRELGIPEDRILPFGMRDNFWDMGDTGPCGPCTEIHYDHVGGRHAGEKVNQGSPEVVEVWNLVFMQYDRCHDGSLVPLPNTHVDTGMGLERIAAVLQGTRSNYNTDLFLPVFHQIHKITGVEPYRDRTGADDVGGLDTAYRIIADHTRMATVCISDGLLPGRLDLEHKLRSVIYRALHQCNDVLRAPPGLLGKLVQPVVESLGEAFPEISSNRHRVKDVLDQTEDRYLQAHRDGKKNFNKLLRKHPGITHLTEDVVHQLHDGFYGNPMSLEMIETLAHSVGLHVDPSMIEHVQEIQKVSSVHPVEVTYPWFTAELITHLHSNGCQETNDDAKYEYLKDGHTYEFPSVQSSILCVVNDSNEIVSECTTGDRVGVILDKTQFYAEKGGQKGDKGTISTQTGSAVIEDTQSSHGYVLHIGSVREGSLKTSQPAEMYLDADNRLGCMKNHTCTHLVNSALRDVLGPDVRQQGSAVLHNKLTFEFSCLAPVNDEDIKQIDCIVNNAIQQNLPVGRQLQPLKQALQTDGVISLENAIYPSMVYVVSVPSSNIDDGCLSAELCGGTHVLQTGDLEQFCITSVTGVATATKSIVCVTGQEAEQALKCAEKGRQLYKELEEAVKRCSDIDRCHTLQKQINMMLSEEVLPKLDKDKLTRRMELIGTEINTAANRHAFLQLEKDLQKKMEDSSDYVVHQFAMKTLQKMNKMMKKFVIKKPTIVVVETSNNTVAYVAMPKNMEPQSDILDKFQADVEGKISQSESQYAVVSRKGKHTQLFMDMAEQTLGQYRHETSA